MKTIGERETQKKQQQQQKTNKDRKEQGETEAIVKGAKWFCCAFKLGFLQLISKYMSQSMLQWSVDL